MRNPEKSNQVSSPQRRVDQIGAFRAEVEQLAREGAPPLDRDQLAAVAAHHDALLERLAREFDVDRTAAARGMSRGMQVASFLGAAALVAAIVSFFYRVWGSLNTPAQVALLVAFPVAAVAAMLVAGRIERTRYVASLCAIVACGAFVLETVALGRMFNLRESAHAIGIWALFGGSVAIPWRFRVPFAFAAGALAVYAGVVAFELLGFQWAQGIERPEPLMVAAAGLLLATPRLPRELAPVARGVLLAIALFPLLVLSAVGGITLLPLGVNAARVVYQVVAVVAAMVVIAAGLRNGQLETLVIGSVFAGLFLVTRFVDWWWDWMPKYLFFLIIAAVAIGWLWALRLARRRVEAAA